MACEICRGKAYRVIDGGPGPNTKIIVTCPVCEPNINLYILISPLVLLKNFISKSIERASCQYPPDR